MRAKGGGVKGSKGRGEMCLRKGVFDISEGGVVGREMEVSYERWRRRRRELERRWVGLGMKGEG